MSGTRGASIYYERRNFPNRDVAELLLRLLPSHGEGQVGPNRHAYRAILASCSDGLPVAGKAKALCPPGAALALKASQFQC